jgi:SpoVK/Ycf46/Vps4 family AAA+-type ATPase
MAKLTSMKESLTQRVIVYGPPKAGKTELVSKLATKYNLLWFDLEKGYAPLFKLPQEAQERVRVISLPDTKDVPVAIRTLLKVVTGEAGSICEKHGEWKCAICAKNPQAESEPVHLRG